jgi:hypothetical protein
MPNPSAPGKPALKYLAAYVYRTAFSAERILADDGQAITFAYRDNQGRPGTVRLSPERFLHRFLQHVLPRGLQRIRYFGFLSELAVKGQLAVSTQNQGFNARRKNANIERPTSNAEPRTQGNGAGSEY